MGTSASSTVLLDGSAVKPPATILGRLFEGTAKAATSWLGLLTAYIAALAGALLAYKNLPPWLQNAPPWQRIVLITAFPALALAFQAIPAAIDQRKKRLSLEISGSARGGYFRLGPLDDEASYKRADRLHHEVLTWVQQASDPVLFLTGMSGSGKSSLLNAWVIPNVQREGTTLIRLRGYKDLGAALAYELQRDDVPWQRNSARSTDLWALLDNASRSIRPSKLLIVIDQFEEFVILQDWDRIGRFEALLASLRDRPIQGVLFLIVFRSDYIGLVEKLAIPRLLQGSTWREVPPFTERDARDFMNDCGLVVDPNLIQGVLREAAELEQVKGLVRPVTVNLCGLVMARFSSGLPRGLRPGNLVRGFLKESLSLPAVRDVAPKLLPQLISNHVTKQPRTIHTMAKTTGLDPADIRGCLRVLGQNDRAIVRPLDENQQMWEISHDFLVPMIDSILAHSSISLWRRAGPWLPWIAVGILAIVTLAGAIWRPNPIKELTELGWEVHLESVGAVKLTANPALLAHSIGALQRVKRPITMTLREESGDLKTVEDLSVLKSLTTLDLSGTLASDLSPLRDLTSLKSLDISGAFNVTDLSPLKNLKSLNNLDISGTSVSSLMPLKDLYGLTSLTLTFTSVNDLTPLQNLKSLTSLNLRSTHVSNLLALQDLRSLTSLNLTSIGASDLTPLKQLNSLTSLNLAGTKVSDLSPLKNIKSLTSLDLSSTLVIDLASLEHLESLTSLGLPRTKVSDLSPLQNLVNLSSLDLSSTPVTDASPLRDLKSLTSLDLSGTKISDVSPLKDLRGLTSLSIANTSVSDVSALKELRNLTSLDLRFTKVSDVTPLRGLKNLHILR